MDNEWVDDHFKSVRISLNARLEQQNAFDEILGEEYIAVTAPGVRADQSRYAGMNGTFPGFNAEQVKGMGDESIQVAFVPYYYRGNRGGRGHMRVGFRIAEEVLPSS